MRYIKINPQNRNADEKFVNEKGLYEILSEYCTNNAHIIEAGPDVGPWTPILLEHIAHVKGYDIYWAGFEKTGLDWKKKNEYSDGVLFNQDICTLPISTENADLALSIRPRVYGVAHTAQGELINKQHMKLLSLLKAGGYLIIMIHKSEHSLVEPFWAKGTPGFTFVKCVEAGPSKISVIRKG